MLNITQRQLANVLCTILVLSGTVMGGISVFEIEGVDGERAERLGAFFFANGISLGFGVHVDSLIRRRRKDREDGFDRQDGIEGVDLEDWEAESLSSFDYEKEGGRESKGDYRE